MNGPIVRPIELRDYTAVERLRDDFFVSFDGAIQVRPFEGGGFVWTVAEMQGRVVAVLSYLDTDQTQRWCWDFYREPGRYGTLGFYGLVNWLEGTADADGKELFFMTDPRNARHRDAVEKSQRGYALVAHVFHRPRWGRR